jgi:alcohol dehydrogenase (NADP+)
MNVGADKFIATAEEPNWWNDNANSLDLIMSAVLAKGFELEKYISLFDVDGTLIQVGAPKDPIPAFSEFALPRKDAKIGGSLIGSRKTAWETIQLAVRANVGAWV